MHVKKNDINIFYLYFPKLLFKKKICKTCEKKMFNVLFFFVILSNHFLGE